MPKQRRVASVLGWSLLWVTGFLGCGGAETTSPSPVIPVVLFEEGAECNPITADEPCDQPPSSGGGGYHEWMGVHDEGLRSAPGDPFPNEPGLWLGNGVTASACFKNFNSSIIDGDYDWLDDTCEFQIAWAFAPRLMLGLSETCGAAEPWWAAKYFPAGGARVRIFYAMSYYQDCGEEQEFGFGGPHSGDSEFIAVEVAYNGVSQHWEFEQMFLSAHYGASTDHSEWVGWSATRFDFRSRTHPSVFVSLGKHANYKDQATCSWALVNFVESCTFVDGQNRVPVLASHNLGSRYHGVTCVPSEERYAGNGRQECYYSPSSGFNGWFPSNQSFGTPATSYRIFLCSNKFERWNGDWGPLTTLNPPVDNCLFTNP